MDKMLPNIAEDIALILSPSLLLCRLFMLRGLFQGTHMSRCTYPLSNIRKALSRHDCAVMHVAGLNTYQPFSRGFSTSTPDDDKKRALEQFMSKTDASALKRHLIRPERKRNLSHGVAKAVLLFETWTVIFCLGFGIYIANQMTTHADQDILTVAKNTLNQFAATSDRLRANLLEKQREVASGKLASSAASEEVDENVTKEMEKLLSQPAQRDSASRNRFE